MKKLKARFGEAIGEEEEDDKEDVEEEYGQAQ